jgi:small subunit ribosomal protein S21
LTQKNRNFNNTHSKSRNKPSIFNPRDYFKGTAVEVRDGGFESALRKFKKKVQENEVLQEVRNREFYLKPSEARKRNRAAARARWVKKQQQTNLMFKKSTK